VCRGLGVPIGDTGGQQSDSPAHSQNSGVADVPESGRGSDAPNSDRGWLSPPVPGLHRVTNSGDTFMGKPPYVPPYGTGANVHNSPDSTPRSGSPPHTYGESLHSVVLKKGGN